MTCRGQERRGVFPPEVRTQVTALACSLPQEKGIALSRWSLSEIVKGLLAAQSVSAISRSTVWRWLRADKLKPWRFHHWQHILNPQKFLERARPVLEAYEKAVEWLRNGIWTVCVDEKTSIQARQLEQEPLPAKPEQPVHVAPRYKRRGALHLFAGWSVADGCVYGQTAERKRFLDFRSFLLQVIFPEALRRKVHTLVLILDNGSTPAPKQLENWLQEQVRLNHWPLTIQVLWLPPNASWLNQILVQHFAAQIVDTQSLSQHYRTGGIDYQVHQPPESLAKTNQLVLHRSETGNKTRNSLMKRCTKRVCCKRRST